MYIKRETTDELVSRVQEVLEDAENAAHATEAIAHTIINLGCHLTDTPGQLDAAMLARVQARYYTPGKATLGDALILQGVMMLGWDGIESKSLETQGNEESE